jgi:hypothetical protein
MVGYLGVTGQPGDVEPEVGKLGPAIPRPAAIPQGLDGGAELLQRVQHSDERDTMWQSSWPASLIKKVQLAPCMHVSTRYVQPLVLVARSLWLSRNAYVSFYVSTAQPI